MEDAPILVYAAPTREKKRQIAEIFKIDEHTLDSAPDPDELGRLDFEEDHVAIIFKRPKNCSSQDNFLFKVWSYGLFLFSNRLVIVRMEDVQTFDSRQFSRVKTPLYVALRVVNRTITHFVDHLRGIGRIAGKLEQKINASMENRYPLNRFTLKKSLVYYLCDEFERRGDREAQVQRLQDRVHRREPRVPRRSDHREQPVLPASSWCRRSW